MGFLFIGEVWYCSVVSRFLNRINIYVVSRFLNRINIFVVSCEVSEVSDIIVEVVEDIEVVEVEEAIDHDLTLGCSLSSAFPVSLSIP